MPTSFRAWRLSFELELLAGSRLRIVAPSRPRLKFGLPRKPSAQS